MRRDDEVVALWQLQAIPGLGNKTLYSLVKEYRSTIGVLDAVRSGKVTKFQNISTPDLTSSLKQQLERLKMLEIAVVFCSDSEYPQKLECLYDPPVVLYVRGTLPNKPVVGIVGTRACTSYGKRISEDLAKSLVQSGVGVISGLAYGIDIAAHKACLRFGGKTYAVLGGGVDVPSPLPHIQVLEQMLQNNGGGISEYQPGFVPTKFTFPQRNRIIAALSEAVVIVEASAKSGALITASFALECGVDVFAVPGEVYNVQAQGTNRLLQQGAQIITSPDDLVSAITGLSIKSALPPVIYNDTLGSQILSQITDGFITIDEVLNLSISDPGSVLSKITELELQGIIRRSESDQLSIN